MQAARDPEEDRLLSTVLETVADAVWIVDAGLSLTTFNAAFAILCAKAFHSFPSLPEDWRDLARRAMSGRTVSSDVHLVIDGVSRSFTISGAPVMRGDVIDAAVFTARDVTDTSRLGREDLLELTVTRVFATKESLEEALHDVLEFVCEADGWDAAVLWLVDSETVKLIPAAVWSRPYDGDAFRERIADLRFARGRGIPGRAWSRDEVVWVADLLDETGLPRADLAARSGLHGVAAVPLHDAEKIVGVLEILTRTVRPISEQRRRVLVNAGDSLGRLIVRRQMQQTIERKGQEWSHTFDAIELPIFITQLDGIIVRCNRAARDLVGGNFKDVVGRSIAITEEEPWRTLGDAIEAVRDSRTPCSAQIVGNERYWDVSASWYRSATDERVIVIMRETTDLIRLQESVRRGEQLAALGELVAGVAHEVRNPIFGMGLTVDTLQAMLPPDQDVVELFTVLRTWLDRLNRLMENLLEYGKSWTLSLREAPLDGVLQEVIDGYRQLATQSAVTIDATIEPGLAMLMDPNRLTHAFENLITNAVQHSKPDQRIEITAHKLHEDGQELIECSVRDHGPGFNPIDLPRIFQPFFTRRRGGTGLGLSIVQRVVDEHGGTVNAGNASDGGAVVVMRFPFYRAMG